MQKRFFSQIFSLSKTFKNLIKLTFDFICLLVCFWAAFYTRTDADLELVDIHYWMWSIAVVVCSQVYFVHVGMYRAVFRYVNASFSRVVIQSIIASSVFLVLAFAVNGLMLPRSLPFIYFAYSMIVIGGSRLAYRNMFHHFTTQNSGEAVIIYGAGSAGRQLYTSLAHGKEYRPVAFADDNKLLHKKNIHGLPVYSADSLESVIADNNVVKILLAIPSANRLERQYVLNALEHFKVHVLTVPSMPELVKGDYQIDQIKQVDISDLLGREPIEPDAELMHANIQDKVVMVTGAGGSIGSELCRQILQQKPQKLLLFDVSEFNLYSIEKELKAIVERQNLDVAIYPLMGTVQRAPRLVRIMETFSVDTIYHAAAYKHVPLVEFNMPEGIANNVFGTLNMARAAMAANVSNFVLISTDKAVRPTNVMGASKRMAELILQALSKERSSTKFCMVRFGNVLGSSGSVIPLFKSQIAAGGPVTITDKEIIRFFMTIPEAAQLVIQAGSMGRGGDVFVLDMGEPIKIYDLAVNMIHLSGLSVLSNNNLSGDIEIKITGLRPGEKLYEELLIGESVTHTRHPRIMTANEECLSWDKLEPILAKLEIASLGFDNAVIREILLSAPTGFKPKDGICDLLWAETNKSNNLSVEM